MLKLNRRIVFILVIMLMLFLGGVEARAVMATGSYGLAPATGSYEVGDLFSVTVDVTSGGDSVAGLDVFGTYDNTKLEMLSIEKVATSTIWDVFQSDFTNPQYMSFSDTAGTFSMTASSINNTPVGSEAISGVFMKLNFKARAEGVASLNFSCSTGSITESNIINTEAMDVIDCASNDSGSYTITTGVGGATSTTTPTPSGVVATPTASELPQTGSLTQLLGMIVFGSVTFLGALMLKWL